MHRRSCPLGSLQCSPLQQHTVILLALLPSLRHLVLLLLPPLPLLFGSTAAVAAIRRAVSTAVVAAVLNGPRPSPAAAAASACKWCLLDALIQQLLQDPVHGRCWCSPGVTTTMRLRRPAGEQHPRRAAARPTWHRRCERAVAAAFVARMGSIKQRHGLPRLDVLALLAARCFQRLRVSRAGCCC